MWISLSTTIRRVLRNPTPANGGLPSPPPSIPSDEEDPSVQMQRRDSQLDLLSSTDLREKSNKAIIEHLKRKYDANQDGEWQDEEVDNMLNDCVDLTRKSEGLQNENSKMLEKVGVDILNLQLVFDSSFMC